VSRRRVFFFHLILGYWILILAWNVILTPAPRPSFPVAANPESPFPVIQKRNHLTITKTRHPLLALSLATSLTLFSASAEDTILHSFTGAPDGSVPRGSLTLGGSNILYGMTRSGGDQSGAPGAIFRINTDGTSYSLLHSFGTGTSGYQFDGQLPSGSLTLSGSTLYGMTYLGGAMNQGAIFSVNADVYAVWASSMGLDGTAGKEKGFGDDPDQDGIANGMEWILGGNPLSNSRSVLPTPAGGGSEGLTLTFTRAKASLTRAALIVQYGADPGAGWPFSAVVGPESSGPDSNGVTVTINAAATPDQVTVHIPGERAINGRIFARLQATMP